MKKLLLILEELNDADLDWMIATAIARRCQRGRCSIQEGLSHQCPVYLGRGYPDRIGGGGGRSEIAQLTSGEVVGEMSFVDESPPSATVTTLTDALILAIPRKYLAQRLEEDIGFASRFYRAIAGLLSQRLRGTVSRLGGDRSQPNTLPTNADST
ncbi:MAG: cyclic nucleotide-binding domain-containing protein, partial [Coleofasciculaceae cyanobacterium SM2_3_26]|nr:cyclic nucleotide-binding domain-containing protein [Coleofasciculaceae cyanobacterium SM2_3_26]